MKRMSDRRMRGSRIPEAKPDLRIELSEKHTGLRIAFVVLCMAVSLAAIRYSVSRFLSQKAGWAEIKPAAEPKKTCAQEFIFQYDLGAEAVSPTAEYKNISKTYTEACGEAYRLFNTYEEFAGCKNLYYLNTHPNEAVTVEEPLYRAFALLEEKGGRFLYMAPIYGQYEALFLCAGDAEAIQFDPFYNNEVKKFIDGTLKFVWDEAAVSLRLLGNNRVELKVSDEYIRYAKKEGIRAFIDFFWLKNAFVADHLAERLIAKGYTHGVIASCDGFSRHLGEVGIPLSYNIFDGGIGTKRIAARITHENHMNIVRMRSYPMSAADAMHYYTWENGDIRGPYIDTEDGRAKAALPDLVAYSDNKGCAEIALDIFDLYASDSFDEDAAKEIIKKGVDLVYCINDVIYYSGKDLEPSDLYKDENADYRKKLLE